MRIEVNTTKNSPYRAVRVVSSHRVDGKPRKKIHRFIGTAKTDTDLTALMREAQLVVDTLEAEAEPNLFGAESTLKQLVEARAQPQPTTLAVDAMALRTRQRTCSGFHDVYGELYRNLRLHRILPASRYRASSSALFHTVMARLANPQSKRRNSLDLATNFGVRLALPKIYRMMDHLDDDHIATTQRLAADAALGLLGGSIDVLLFDCTTLYFESFNVDTLRQPGYSKDAKFKESQVLLALMVTGDGLPVGYELLPGASFEGHSLIQALDHLRERIDVRHAVCVADRGMFSAANLQHLTDAGVYFVVGAKLKRRAESKAIVAWANAAGNATARYQEWALDDDRRLVVSWSAARATRDGKQRERLLAKLRRHVKDDNRIPANAIDTHGGARRFVRREATADYRLDETKIANAEQWDGVHGVITNLPADTAMEDVCSYYHDLWQVESVFRVTKHDLKIRPIFHWTERRIKAHIAIAFMSLVLVRHLMYRLKIRGHPMSAETIRVALNTASESMVQEGTTGPWFALPDKPSRNCETIYRTVGLKRSTRPYVLNVD